MAQINQFTNEPGASFIDNSNSVITISPEGTKVCQNIRNERGSSVKQTSPSSEESSNETSSTSKETDETTKQLTNRQVVIMMAGLLDISLSPDYTNQKQLATFVSRITGRSEQSIRQTIMHLAKTGIETPQARNDSRIVADVLEPICKKVASKIRNDAEE